MNHEEHHRLACRCRAGAQQRRCGRHQLVSNGPLTSQSDIMSANTNLGLQDVSTEFVDPYRSASYNRERGLDEVIDHYNKAAQGGNYERNTFLGGYTGPAMAADFIERYFGDRKDNTYIIDVAAGTGLVGDELKKRGFSKMDALDPADDMLSIAIAKNIYGRIIHDCMDGHRTDIKDGKEVYYRSQYGYSTTWASTALTTNERSGKGVF
ncbi:hypothetical protein LSAT2_009666 [Lamellibrachia satsuma]|nr:hypothetical protein LSAT2_009666 [Lamellibrachia satsuma]